MIITYFRSSSLGNWAFCQVQYYITYVLGFQRDAGKKAELGTIVHKVLEILALAKQQYDNTGEEIITIKEPSGDYVIDTKEWLKPYFYSFETAEAVNKTRINKSKYKSECRLSADHIQYGKEFLDALTVRVYDYYKSKSKHEYEKIDLVDVKNWVWMAVDYQKGAYDPRKRKIVSPEQSFDIEIKRKWAKYSYELDGKKIKGNLAIKGTIDLVTDIGDGVYEIVDWKGLPIETPIPTINGWKTMGDLSIGDIIFDKDGKQTKVIAKSKQTVKPCYEITFDDTTKVICDNEHLWLLDNNQVVPITKLKIGDKIDVTKPLDIEDVKLPIDPYILGLWLGDGRNRSPEITSGDSFIFEEILRRGYKLGKNIDSKNPNLETKTILGVRHLFSNLNLLNNKHIPSIYLRASYQQRLDLLRGLMDSDGNVNTTRKQAVYTSCNKKLSDNVKELLLSLGQRVNQSSINRNTNFKLNVNIYPLAFRPININPFLLPRKANIIDCNWGNGNSNRRLIKNIELLSTQQTQCISVDSPTKTYLCTENMIPTHNTGQRLDWATGEVKDYAKLQKDPQLMLYYYAARHIFPDAKSIMLTIFFVRDGGPFTICFDDSTLLDVEKHLQNKMIEISSSTSPKMLDPRQKDFRCQKLCDYYKNNLPGEKTNICTSVCNTIKLIGIGKTTEKLKNPNFEFGQYQAPGGE